MTAERRLALKLAAAVGALALATAGPTSCSEPKARFHAVDVADAPWGQGFGLPDLKGNTVTHESFPGKVTAVFFGFMYCPDVCPTHLTKMGEVKKLLGKHADKVQLVFITVDPERDLPEKLLQYLQSFDPSIVGLRGSLEQTQALAKDFRVFYKKVATKDSNKDSMAYTIDHTTFTYVFDGQGKLRLVIPHDLPAEKIASDFQHLISR